MISKNYPGRIALRLIFCMSFFLITLFHVFPQSDTVTIKLPVKWASAYRLILNESGYACLFLDQGDKYCIMLLDSNYNTLAEFKDKYYTSTKANFVGSIAEAEGFELFFKRVEDDVLLVLKIDIPTKNIERIKDYKISENPGERVLYTGSNISGDAMLTLSYYKSGLIYKKHLFGLKTEDINIPLQKEDIKIIKKEGLYYFLTYSDTLIFISRIQSSKDKNATYRGYTFDLESKTYCSIDLGCGQEKKQAYLHADYFRNVWMLENCNKKLQFFDGNTGELIKEIAIDYDSIFQNNKIKLFQYCYWAPLDPENENRYTYAGEGKKIRFKEDGFKDPDCYYDFIMDSTQLFMEIKIRGSIDYENLSGSFYTKFYLPFDWITKEISSFTTPDFQLKMDKLVMHELDIQKFMNTGLSNYFIGFDGKMKFGYLLNIGSKFIIEPVSD